jgi:EAL domain-containing protein (putative c-di-GMP-specific phosphodiesterase class I)
VLAVDDDALVLHAYQRVLTAAGYHVECAQDGEGGLEKLRARPFDTVISDISMPGMDGLSFLRQVRAVDLDLPVILVTGYPTVGTAADAVETGAFRYLTKPVDMSELERSVNRAVVMRQMAVLKREALSELGFHDKQVGDRIGLEVQLARALESLWLAFQPIIQVSDGGTFGYEALLRSREPTLPTPGAVLDAAERTGKLATVGRTIRRNAAKHMAEATPTWLLFVNLHPADLADDQLLVEAEPLSQMAKRVVLEVTERAMLDSVPQVKERIATLRRMGFRLAIDDLGAGYAGLTSFAQLEPEIVKLDMSLIRNIHTSPIRQRLVRSLTELCRSLSIQVVAEGIETLDEWKVAVDLGCDLLQGYLIGKPAFPFPTPEIKGPLKA